MKYDIIREGDDTILRVDYSQQPKMPSLEDSGECMANTVHSLLENPRVTKIIFNQNRDYEYDQNQTELLHEMARLYDSTVKNKDMFSLKALGPGCQQYYSQRFPEIKRLITDTILSDPIGAYVELKRIHRREAIALQKSPSKCVRAYIKFLEYIIALFEQTKLIKLSERHLAGHQVGNREIYRHMFLPVIKPDFMFTKLMATYPVNGNELDSYTIGNIEVTIFSRPDTVQYLYHVIPPEFKLDEEKYELLDMARKIMADHKPRRSEFVDPDRMRQVFSNVGSDLLEELSNTRGIRLRQKELKELTEILVRYTVGFGLIEVLLKDEKIQDISINSPMGQTPIFIVHQDFDDCTTNIEPVVPEAESWATKLRLISGRPLDEANPILDTELELPGVSTRVAAVTAPLNPYGLAFSFRRHRDRPWTLPLFMNYKMITAEAAGLISFLVDGSRSFMIAGTRSSGKSSLLSAMMIEIMRRYRIITIEDTLELPTRQMRNLGFNIQSLKVASALSREGSEVSASTGIRSTLRLGDSALIVGEVRSQEAKSLYEAMRVGAAANVVAGTIHGDSPYGVFDRVVNDIGVPKTSFKATDIIIVANPLRSSDGIHRTRRVTQITEVRKRWSDDPLLENAFMDLMKYDVKKDALNISDELINGESEVLKTIAGNIRDFAGDWDAVWQNIILRSRLKQLQLDASLKIKRPELLEAQFSIGCNDRYHLISERVKEEVGSLDPKRILTEWKDWFQKEVRNA
ncbi:MAG: type II/IV secretion system ATPase subunit [Nanoarchaeota archaeon]|nr:type II/IV secretion system ATPase subunit [Nanoarchaeota archaeon]